MKTTDTVKNNCWSCGTEFDAVSDVVGERKPDEGDFSLCIMCGAPGVFRADLSTRKPTREEMVAIMASPTTAKHMLAIMMLHSEKEAGDLSA